MHGPHWNKELLTRERFDQQHSQSWPHWDNSVANAQGSYVRSPFFVQDSPERPSTPADLQAIVDYIAYRCLKSECDWSEDDLRQAYPQLDGITSEQLHDAIQKGLA